MNIQCSWKVSDERPISDAIFYNRESEDADLEDEINVENCVLLKAPDKSEGLYPTVPACQLLICSEPPNYISRISTICEARVIEIYGHHGEYLKTVFNYPLDESENLFVFRGDVTLNKPLSVCSVKFVNLQSPNEMWLFGVKIHTDKSYIPQNLSASLQMAAVEQRLEEMGDTLDNKDELLKRCIGGLLQKEFSKLPPAIQSPEVNMPDNWLLQVLSNSDKIKDILRGTEETREELKEREKIEENANEELQSSTSNKESNLMSVSTSVIVESQSTCTQTEEEYKSVEENLKTYVNEKMEEMNKRFSEMEAKILCKLDEIESFVKPQGMPK